MKINRLVIGSKNKAKLDEWGEFFGEFVEVVPIHKLGEFADVEETGESFEENAILKARHYAKLTGEYVFAEDGGFEVEYLGGEPGVKSRRVLPGNRDATDEQLVEFILGALKDVPKEKRRARLKAVAVISDPKGNIIFKDEAYIEGLVPESVSSVKVAGYPYRDLLYLEEARKLYSELSDEEHDKLSHKKKIAKKIEEFLKNA